VRHVGHLPRIMVLTVRSIKLQENAKAVDVRLTPSLVDREVLSHKFVFSIILSSWRHSLHLV